VTGPGTAGGTVSGAPGAAGPVAFSPEQLAEVRRLQALYPEPRAALLPVLRLAQETFGHVAPEVETYVAGLFGLTPAHVHEVVTFYTLFFQRPVGRHVLAVCHNLSCALLGAESAIAYLEERLGIEAGETTPDGRVTLLRVECLCACEAAPMMQVDDRYVGPLDRATIDRVLEGLR
jgi:NADH-quinone oxidoreductase subunit E